MSFLNLRKKKNDVPQGQAPVPVKKVLVRDESKPKQEASSSFLSASAAQAILRPHVTEKATALSARGVYVFEVLPRATKRVIAEAIAALYKVKPARVSITKIPGKRITVKGKPGMKKGGKKAYVYLRPGDKIEVV